LEPFLFIDGKLVSWNDVITSQNLKKNYLPISSVNWVYNDLNLSATAFAWGDADSSSILFVNYRIENKGSSNSSGKLFIALRPFQVNPYYQFLNLEGGTTRIKSIELQDKGINVNKEKKIISLTEFDEFGASEFDHGEIINFISKGKLPVESSIFDKRESASAALSYNFDLQTDEFKEVILVIPFYPDKKVNIPIANDAGKTFRDSLNKCIEYWEKKFTIVNIKLPNDYQKIVNTIKSNIAYILINKDGAGIQPGSRSYERSWIRDGSLTASALLKMGLHKEVKSFIEWYTKYQFQNGKVPCVVDSRGPDPVPENDSNGELIFLIKQYFNFSDDTTFLQSKYSNVKSAVNYIKLLIDQRSTDYFKSGYDSVRSFYGLVPESISHEGYSAKPMHSYWDNFWTLRGLKDAAEIAKILMIQEDELYFSKLRDTFQTNLMNSINLTMKNHKIDYIPGCAELGDFDAASTSIALYPGFAQNILPPDAVEKTFNKYYEYFSKRKNNQIDWINYTPYEVRLIGSFIMLGEIDKANELIEFFLNDQRPEGWNHWAEVVWHDKRHPGFIGDMPHTWVGSDFINSLRNYFVYENELDSSIIIGAGLMKEWINSEEGIEVSEMPTYYGKISYSVKKQGNIISIKIDGSVRIPTGGIILKNKYLIQDEDKVTINGKPEKFDKKIKITSLPCQILIQEN
jgi:hypothetical protein